MKILILTEDDNVKTHFMVDKIVSYSRGKGDTVTVVSMLDGSCHYVKETPEFITNQLVVADTSSYVVYNSEEHK